jgi:hypothetical protein
MSLFTSLFKRKVGGTFLGNLVRGVVKKIPVVGSLLGNGAMMITKEQAAARDAGEHIPQLTDAVKAQVGAGLAGAYENIVALQQSNSTPLTATPANPLAPYTGGAIAATSKKYGVIAAVVGGVAVLVLIIVKLFKRK